GRAVEAPDVPRRFGADAVDRADIAAVGCGRGGLLQFPKILRKTGDRRRRVDDIFGAVEGEGPPAFGKMPVVADIDAELAVGGLEHRPTRIAGLKKEFFVEAGDLRNVGLAVLAEIF